MYGLFSVLDAGALTLILYGPDQVMDKIAVLRVNALYLEKIETDTRPLKKKKSKGLATSRSQPSTSVSSPPRYPNSERASSTLDNPEIPPISKNPLEYISDVHCDLYALPNLADVFQLITYLHTTYGMQLRPVSTLLHYSVLIRNSGLK